MRTGPKPRPLLHRITPEVVQARIEPVTFRSKDNYCSHYVTWCRPPSPPLRSTPSPCAPPGWWPAPTPPLATTWPVAAWTTSAPSTAWRHVKATSESAGSYLVIQVGGGGHTDWPTGPQHSVIGINVCYFFLEYTKRHLVAHPKSRLMHD